MLKKSADGRKWDEDSKTPNFHYTESNTTYQVWYDDPESLYIKYKVDLEWQIYENSQQLQMSF